MSTPNDGGPAYPHDGQTNYTGGMTLRDYFAGQALAGLMANNASDTPAPFIAFRAHAYADAMLAARAGKGEET